MPAWWRGCRREHYLLLTTYYLLLTTYYLLLTTYYLLLTGACMVAWLPKRARAAHNRSLTGRWTSSTRSASLARGGLGARGRVRIRRRARVRRSVRGRVRGKGRGRLGLGLGVGVGQAWQGRDACRASDEARSSRACGRWLRGRRRAARGDSRATGRPARWRSSPR